MAYPEFAPNEIPTAITMNPTIQGALFPRGGWLKSSVTAHTNRARKKVPTTSSKNGPATLWKYGAGNVAKVLYVAREFGCPLMMWLIWS